MSFEQDLDQPLLKLTPWDVWTIRSAAAHTLVTGASGSGKTSGPANSLTMGFLSAGMGALALCYKVDEADLWDSRAAQTGRGKSLMRWSGPNYRFNFIAYFLEKYGAKGIGSVIETLVSLLDMMRLAGSSPGRTSDQFWLDAIREMMRHTLAILHAATGTVRIADLIAFIRSAPQTPEQMKDPEWQKGSFFFKMFAKAHGVIEPEGEATSLSYWRDDYGKLDNKTRSNIQISLTTALGRLSSGLLHDLFCTDTNIWPELCFDGAIIVMDFPPAVFGEDGVVAQLLFKNCWQQAMLARNALPPDYRRRFVALVMDECQAFIVPSDADFLATCRSSRVCVLCLTQSLPTIYSKIGGDNPKDRAHHFISNFSTKIWCSNSCVETNTWASDTIGRSLQRRGSFNQGQGANHGYGMGMGEGTSTGSSWGGGSSSSTGPGGSSWSSSSNSGGNYSESDNWNRSRNSGTSWNTSQGYSETMDRTIEAGFFASSLKTGGAANGNIVNALWFESGRCFAASDATTLFVSWRQ